MIILRQLIIIISFLPLSLFAQESDSLTLVLSTGDCRTGESVRIGSADIIRFYQNGKLYKQIVPMNYSEWPIEIPNFKPGKYLVTFMNLYNQRIKKTITIPDTAKYELKLCPDLLDSYPKNTLASLQNGETLKINFYSQGCFHNDKKILKILKKDDLFSAQLQYDSKVKSVILNATQIEEFKRFENELRKIKDSYGCSTTDVYKIISKVFTLTITDGGCEWLGFYFLCRALFGKIE